MAAPSYIICWRSGEVEIVDRVPKGALNLAHGRPTELEGIVGVVARHGYDGVTMLVPGVPEAEAEADALKAVEHFRGMIFERMSNPHGGL